MSADSATSEQPEFHLWAQGWHWPTPTSRPTWAWAAPSQIGISGTNERIPLVANLTDDDDNDTIDLCDIPDIVVVA